MEYRQGEILNLGSGILPANFLSLCRLLEATSCLELEHHDGRPEVFASLVPNRSELVISEPEDRLAVSDKLQSLEDCRLGGWVQREESGLFENLGAECSLEE